MSTVNPTFEPGDDGFLDEPVFYCTADPDPDGRFQNYRGVDGRLFADDPPESVVEDDYWWGIYFSAPVQFETDLQAADNVTEASLAGLKPKDVTLLAFVDNMTGSRIPTDTLLRHSDNYPADFMKVHCLDYLKTVSRHA